MFTDTQVTIAIIGLLSLGVPIFNNYLQSRLRSKEKLEDAKLKEAELKAREAREDLIAERVDAASRAAKESARLVIDATIQASNVASAEREKLDSQVKQIHTLVNSGTTAQMEAILTGAKAQLAFMASAMALQAKTNEPISPIAQAAYTNLENSIKDQEKTLIDRKVATDAAAAAKTVSDTLANTKAQVAVGLQEAAKVVRTDDRFVEAAKTMKGAADVINESADTMNRTAEKAAASVDKLTKT